MQIDKSKVFGVYNNQHTSIFIYFKKSAEGGGGVIYVPRAANTLNPPLYIPETTSKVGSIIVFLL